MDAQAVSQDLLKLAPRDPTRDAEVVISGQDPMLSTNYLLGTAGAAPAVRLSETSPHWTRPRAPYGQHQPEWPA